MSGQTLTLVAFLFLLVPCIVTADDKLPFKEDDVREKVYDKTYRVPKGFYEDKATSDGKHSLYFHQPDWFADDKDKAEKIVADFLAKPSNIAAKKIEEKAEDPKFFAFRAGTIWYRVHKPSWFEWKGKRVGEANLGLADGKEVEIGKLKTKRTRDAVKELAEYEWQIENYNLVGAKVLLSEGKEEGGKIVHDLYVTNVTFGDFGLNDEIRVVKVTFTVDKDGKTTKSQKVVANIKGKKN